MTFKDNTPSSTPPPIPPTSEDESFARLRLLRSRRVGVLNYKRLLTEHGTAQNALAALLGVARSAGVPNYEICPEGVIHAELRAAKSSGARLIMQGTDAYPDTLNKLNDAPPFFSVLVDISLLHRPKIWLVGAGNASSLGTRMAKAKAHSLGASGYVIVSGLAHCVDAAAHLAAQGTRTIAVQAGGVDVMYPAENTKLAADIAASGLRLSEQPMARYFPSRNRIIAGLLATPSSSLQSLQSPAALSLLAMH
jgi:DNA processing protein